MESRRVSFRGAIFEKIKVFKSPFSLSKTEEANEDSGISPRIS